MADLDEQNYGQRPSGDLWTEPKTNVKKLLMIILVQTFSGSFCMFDTFWHNLSADRAEVQSVCVKHIGS